MVSARWPEDAEPFERPHEEATGNEGPLDEAVRSRGGREVSVVLREARERLGVTREQASIDTHIPARYLDALEGDADESQLPEPPYDRYFLREYADYLRLDPGPLLSGHDSGRHTDPGLVVQPLPVGAPRGPRRWTGGALLAVSLAVVAGLVASQVFSGDPADLRAPPPSASPPPAATVPPIAQPPAPPSPPPVRRMTAVFDVSEACWVRALADGELVLQETLDPGDLVTVRARRELELRLGNGGGVRLEVNGERVPTGEIGEVVDVTLTLAKGRVTRS